MKICTVWGKSTFWRPWDTLLLAYDIPASDVYVIMESGSIPEESRVMAHATVIESAAQLPFATLVVAAPPIANCVKGDEPLSTFEHPDSPIYMFGADNISLNDKHLGGRVPQYKVYIPLPGQAEVNSHVAAAIFLYDRRLRGSAET